MLNEELSFGIYQSVYGLLKRFSPLIYCKKLSKHRHFENRIKFLNKRNVPTVVLMNYWKDFAFFDRREHSSRQSWAWAAGRECWYDHQRPRIGGGEQGHGDRGEWNASADPWTRDGEAVFSSPSFRISWGCTEDVRDRPQGRIHNYRRCCPAHEAELARHPSCFSCAHKCQWSSPGESNNVI